MPERGGAPGRVVSTRPKKDTTTGTRRARKEREPVNEADAKDAAYKKLCAAAEKAMPNGLRGIWRQAHDSLDFRFALKVLSYLMLRGVTDDGSVTPRDLRAIASAWAAVAERADRVAGGGEVRDIEVHDDLAAGAEKLIALLVAKNLAAEQKPN